MAINAPLLCKKCDHVTSVPQMVFRQRRKAGLPFTCKHCGEDLMVHGTSQKKGATDSQKRSRVQEKRVAAREGGRRQPGSGAADGFEGDVRAVGRYRGECKLTRAASYSLKLKDLMKLEGQAGKGELPVFDVEFQGVTPHKRYVILPEWVFDTLMEEAGRRNHDE